MKALLCRANADDIGTAKIEDVTLPDLGEHEIRIRVRASAVNFPDILMIQGKYQHRPELPYVVGGERAGEVIAIGAGVTRFGIGDRVVGGALFGGFAEEAQGPESSYRPIAGNVDDATAACFTAAYLTAYVSLVRRGELQRGETLLAHGAAGGVGLAAVDLGKLLGATVIATASSDEKRAFLKDYGADHVLPSSGFREAVKELTGGRGADVIYDPVGGDVFDESVRCIAFGGRILIVGFTSGRIPSVSVNMPLIKGFSVVGVRAGEYGRQFPAKGRENNEAIWKLAEDGLVKPRVDAEYPLDQWRAAFDSLADRKVIGKTIIRPDL